MARRLQYGVDFSGGVAAQVRFEHPVSDKQLIGALDPMHLEGLMTQQYGDNNSVWLLRFGLPDMPAQQLGEALLSHLQTVDDGGTVSLIVWKRSAPRSAMISAARLWKPSIMRCS